MEREREREGGRDRERRESGVEKEGRGLGVRDLKFVNGKQKKDMEEGIGGGHEM